MRSGGQLLVDQLIKQGVKDTFCVPGESYLAVLDALYLKRKHISLYVARQDGGAAFMAEAYGKATGKNWYLFCHQRSRSYQCQYRGSYCISRLNAHDLIYWPGGE